MEYETRQNVEGYGVSVRQATSLLRECSADLIIAAEAGCVLRDVDAKELLAKLRAAQRELTELRKDIKAMKETP